MQKSRSKSWPTKARMRCRKSIEHESVKRKIHQLNVLMYSFVFCVTRSDKNVCESKWKSNPCKTSITEHWTELYNTVTIRLHAYNFGSIASRIFGKVRAQHVREIHFFPRHFFLVEFSYLMMQLCNIQTYTHIKRRRSLCWLLVLQFHFSLFCLVFLEYTIPYKKKFCKNRDIADCYVAHWLLLGSAYNQYD